MDAKLDITFQYLKQFVESIRPQEIEMREQVDIGFSWENNKAILFEIRPKWNNPEEVVHREFAKISFTKSKNQWKLYWMRAHGKWELYEPFPTANNLPKLLDIIKEDALNCFFG